MFRDILQLFHDFSTQFDLCCMFSFGQSTITFNWSFINSITFLLTSTVSNSASFHLASTWSISTFTRSAAYVSSAHLVTYQVHDYTSSRSSDHKTHQGNTIEVVWHIRPYISKGLWSCSVVRSLQKNIWQIIIKRKILFRRSLAATLQENRGFSTLSRTSRNHTLANKWKTDVAFTTSV